MGDIYCDTDECMRITDGRELIETPRPYYCDEVDGFGGCVIGMLTI